MAHDHSNCPGCGADAEQSARFCPKCGNAISHDQLEPASSVNTDGTRHRRRSFWIAFLVFLLIVCVWQYRSYWNRRLIDAVTQGTGNIDAILSYGASPNATEYDGDRQPGTALMIAVHYGHTYQVETLLRRGADVNAKDPDGATALMIAVDPRVALADWRSGGVHSKLAAMLLAAGANPNARRNDGATALMLAAKGGNPRFLQALLDKGADVNTRTGQGTTALMIAAAEGHEHIVSALVAKGADRHATSAAGKTALDIASAAGHLGVVRLLLEAQDGSQPGDQLSEAEKPGASEEGWSKVPHTEGDLQKATGELVEASYGSRGGSFSLKTSDNRTVDFGYYDAPNEPPLPDSGSLPSQQNVGQVFEVQYRAVTYSGPNPGTSPLRIVSIRQVPKQ